MISVFVVYIDTGSSMPISPSKSSDLADENSKIMTEWKWFETIVFNYIMPVSVIFGADQKLVSTMLNEAAAWKGWRHQKDNQKP